MDGSRSVDQMESFVPSADTARAFRDALGMFATGVTIVTTRTDQGAVGITANSFSSVSLDPALVMWCPARSSSRFSAFTECAGFAIHVLDQDQKDLGNAFVKNGQAFDRCDWSEAADGTPLIHNALARFHCKPHAFHDGGDHVIAVGEVISAATRPGAPLLFASGSYGHFVTG